MQQENKCFTVITLFAKAVIFFCDFTVT